MTAPAFDVTKAVTSTAGFPASDIGDLAFQDGKAYRLCVAGGTLAAQQTVVTALSSGVPTWSVSTTTTANNHLVAGVLPVGHEGATSGQYIYVQVSGPVKIISAAAIAAGGLVGTSTAAGKADDATVAAGVGAMGVALEAASGADESTDVLLKGLI